MIKNDLIEIYNDDCFKSPCFDHENSVDLIVMDGPYFIEGMGDDWDKTSLSGNRSKKSTVGSLPGGMKFDPSQGKKIQEFYNKLGKQLFKILKPGGFAISFAQARLYHRMTIGLEDCGFETRDMLGWKYEGQAKAFSQDHFIKKMKITQEEKDKLIKSLNGRKTPQLKPMIEPMCLLQKPKEGTFVENWVKFGVGLIDTSQQWQDKFPGNIIECKKPSKQEKGLENDHLTVKPLKLIEHIIKIFSKEGDVVCDPTLGSGTTALAALNAGRKIIGCEIDSNYFKIIKERIKDYV